MKILLSAGVLLLAGCEATTELTEPAVPGRVLLDEDFTFNSGNWYTGTREGSYRFEFLDGQYRLQSWNDTGVAASKSIPIPDAENFDIRVSLNLREAGDDLGYGVCWGGRDRDNRSCFFISGDSRYTLFRRAEGEIIELRPWSWSSAVHPKQNRLEIRKREGFDLYFVNGQRIDRLPHQAFQGSQLGFSGDGKIDFSVDRLEVLVE